MVGWAVTGSAALSLQGSRMDEQRCSFPPPLKVGLIHNLSKSLGDLDEAGRGSRLPPSGGGGAWEILPQLPTQATSTGEPICFHEVVLPWARCWGTQLCPLVPRCGGPLPCIGLGRSFQLLSTRLHHANSPCLSRLPHLRIETPSLTRQPA